MIFTLLTRPVLAHSQVFPVRDSSVQSVLEGNTVSAGAVDIIMYVLGNVAR